jgi:hypothetical protein
VEKAAFILPPLFSVCQPFLNDCPKLSLASSSIALWGTLRNAGPKLWNSLKEASRRPREAIPAALLHSFNVGAQGRILWNTYKDVQEMYKRAEKRRQEAEDMPGKVREDYIKTAHGTHGFCVFIKKNAVEACLDRTIKFARSNKEIEEEVELCEKWYEEDLADCEKNLKDDLARIDLLFMQKSNGKWAWREETDGTSEGHDKQSQEGTKPEEHKPQSANSQTTGDSQKSSIERLNAAGLSTDSPQDAARVLNVKIDPACETARRECAETCQRIKSAYRTLARKVHPDKNPHDKEAAHRAFQNLGKLTETLHKTYLCN